MNRITGLTIVGLAFAGLLPVGSAQAAGAFSVLYNFQGGNDGASPSGQLITDSAGNLYGTTQFGGGFTGCGDGAGCGTVFKLTPAGSESVLHALNGISDGAFPDGPLYRNRDNLYGAAAADGGESAGAVFKITGAGTYSVIHAFAGPPDGFAPDGGLTKGGPRHLYGTTLEGGTGNCAIGCGTVYKITKNGTETVLYSFTGGGDAFPTTAPIRDSKGNLYGTLGGDGPTNWGEIYKIAPDGSETVLHSFTDGSDGGDPQSSLLMDSAGNLYGTAGTGGTGSGTVFRLAPDGTFTVLYGFAATGADGEDPTGNLVRDTKGDLFGTTFLGGPSGGGEVFEIDPYGREFVLYGFTGGNDGAGPSGLLRGPGGLLYGTTPLGGSYGQGVIYEVAPFE
jgi:uncharacterized repeat protein (TIGR03803 family)